MSTAIRAYVEPAAISCGLVPAAHHEHSDPSGYLGPGIVLESQTGLSKFIALGNDITVKSRSYEECVIDVGSNASLKWGFCEQNVT